MSAELIVDNSRAIWWAAPIPAPYGKPRPRRLTLKIGLRYERACVQAVKNAVDLETGVLAGQWIRYQRLNGATNICQPDITVVKRDFVVAVECKNTWTDAAWEQISLYCEVCSEIFKRRAIGFQMCKNVTPQTRDFISFTLDSAIARTLDGQAVTLHWSGKGRI